MARSPFPDKKALSLLLSFGNDIACVRDKAGLAGVITGHLKKLSLIKEYVICTVDIVTGTHEIFLSEPASSCLPDSSLTQPAEKKTGNPDGIRDIALYAEEPQLFDIDELMKTREAPDTIYFWKTLGYDQVTASSLRVGNDYLGILWIQPGRIDNFLLKGISSQIAIAVANITLNEKIEQQLNEISNYKKQLEEEKLYLQQEVGIGYSYSEIIGSGTEMKAVYEQMSQVAFATSTVLILGETGTGKELIARGIHNASPRKHKLMVKVNCAAIPVNLIESELFGHEKGAFTGATERRIGKFELANDGTLFLDEIGEMPLELQVKLLRAIQEKEIERIGGRTVIKINVRIIAATNRDLLKGVHEGNFRSDLYYRLNVFPITLPPLRQRAEDIPALTMHFLNRFARTTGKKIDRVSNKVMTALAAYEWPGNVRELEHLIERSVLVSRGAVLKEVQLPAPAKPAIKPADGDKTDTDRYIKTMEENERDHILFVLRKTNGKIYGKGGAASLLDMHVSTLNSRIKKLGIKKQQIFSV